MEESFASIIRTASMSRTDDTKMGGKAGSNREMDQR